MAAVTQVSHGPWWHSSSKASKASTAVDYSGQPACANDDTAAVECKMDGLQSYKSTLQWLACRH
jgi:hypothetical protein